MHRGYKLIETARASQCQAEFFSNLLENRSVRLYSIRPSHGGVPFESTLANDC